MGGFQTTSLAQQQAAHATGPGTPAPAPPPPPPIIAVPQPTTPSALVGATQHEDDAHIRWGDTVSYPDRRLTVKRAAKTANPYGGARPGPNEAKKRSGRCRTAAFDLPLADSSDTNQGLIPPPATTAPVDRRRCRRPSLNPMALVPWRPHLNALQQTSNWLGPMLRQKPAPTSDTVASDRGILGAKSEEFLSLSLSFPMASFGSANQTITVLPTNPTPTQLAAACAGLRSTQADISHLDLPPGTLVLGVDTETLPTVRAGKPNPVCLLQLATDTAAFLFRLSPQSPLPADLEHLINDPKVVIVGQNAQQDLDEIWWASKPLAPRVIELTSAMPNCGCRGKGIPVYTAALLGLRMSKDEQRSNWEAVPLTDAQTRYAAMDAWTARAVYLASQPPYLEEAPRRRPSFFTSPPSALPNPASKASRTPLLDTFVLPGFRMEQRNKWEILATMRKPMVVKWAKFLRLDQVNTSNAPHILVTQGHTLQEDLHLPLRPPSWIIIDGGCLHNSTVQVLAARGYFKWGVRASVSAWAAHLDDDHTLKQYGTLDSFAAAFLKAIQRDIQKSYFSIGGAKFRTGYAMNDFAFATVRDILPNPTTVATTPTRSDWRLSYTRRCPLEPATSALPLNDPQITGMEVPEALSQEELLERARDLKQWQAAGQLWIDAFLPPARKRVLTFLNDNAQANATVARSAESWSSKHAAPFKFGKVDDLKVTQAELRPGARGQLWKWRNGRCTTTTFAPITDQVGFNVPNVRQACQLIRFRDNRALQMLTTTGSSHMTENFPLTSLASRNHQGAAHFPAVVTALMIDKVESGDVEEISPNCFATEEPTSLPFCIMPVNGSEANLKEAQYFNQLEGRDFKPNVRPTFDGSSPHSEEGDSINEQTILPPELETEWSSGSQVEESLRVMLSIGCEIMGMKIDLAKSYFQIWHQRTQLWRQQTYHVHSVKGTISRRLHVAPQIALGGSIGSNHFQPNHHYNHGQVRGTLPVDRLGAYDRMHFMPGMD